MSIVAGGQSTDDVIYNDQPALDAAPHRKDQDTCCICLKTITERAVAVPCNHLTFDFLCLASWVEEHPKCPLCNVPLTAIEYDWRAPDDFKRYRIPSHDSTSGSRTLGPRFPITSYRGVGGCGRRTPRHHFNQRVPASTSEEAALSRRRHIYRVGLFSLHIGSNRHSRFKDFTPPSFARSSDLQSRARTFLRRELRVFDFTHQTAEFLLTYTISILKTVEMKHSSGKAQELLGEFLGEQNAGLFCHELESWLRSPFAKLEDWDRWVQYSTEGEMAIKGSSRAN